LTLAVDHKVGAARSDNDYLSFSRARGSIDAMDGLRTLAIVLVLFRHAIKAIESRLDNAFSMSLPWGDWNLATPMLNGWVGVDLFFVLSGFLIGGHLIRQRDGFSLNSLGHYFGARALRIVPTYFCVLFLVAGGFCPLYTPLADDILPALIWHMAFLQDYLPSNFIVAFWSLGVEEKFYILAPLLVLGTSRIKSLKARFALLTTLSLAPMALRATTLGFVDFDFTSYRAYFETFRSPFHLTFDSLLIGVVCAEICSHPKLRAKLATMATGLLCLGITIIGVHLVPYDLMGSITVYDVVFQPFALSLGFGLIVLALVLIDPKKGWVASRFSLIGARLSYSLYLVHMALIPSAMVPTLLSGTEGMSAFAIFFAAFVVLSTAASLALHFAVEKPFLLLKSRWF
jgi:peptidoglycan/LPS O-acetylase OafA/YrhL